MQRIIILLTSSENDRKDFVDLTGDDHPYIIVNTANSQLSALADSDSFSQSEGDSQIIIAKMRRSRQENEGNVNAILHNYECDAVVGVHITYGAGTIDEKIGPERLRANCKRVAQYSTQNEEIDNLLRSIIGLAKKVLSDNQQRPCVAEFERLWNILYPWTPWRYEYFLEATLRMFSPSPEDLSTIQSLLVEVGTDGLTHYERQCALTDGEKANFQSTKEKVLTLLKNYLNLDWRGSQDHVALYNEIHRGLYDLARNERAQLSNNEKASA
jgi:hypothetical protein